MMTSPYNLSAARAKTIELMRQAPLDVLVVGGGIVGSGVARDAAMRGLRAGLIDRVDFAGGTSSRSSRLLHGGLRYLAQGRIGLVREASVEKVTIHKIAPHLADPLPFIFPTRKGTEWKRWKLSIGVKIYDLLCSGRNLGKSRTLSRDETLGVLPNLNPHNLTGAVRYFDGMTNDARLVLDTLRSAQASGAMLLNYASLATSQRLDDTWRCRITDHDGDDSFFDVSARVIVNAAGAWADRFPASEVKLRLTKGVHLVIDRSRLNIPDAIVMAEGSRILFAIPWGDRIILGTTDTDYTGSIDAPDASAEDVDYILKVTNDTFPAARLTSSDVISAWSGLRPLIRNGAATKGKPSDISRAHQIRVTQPGWIDVAGGKLTTYRLMAEQTVDQAIKQLPSSDAHPCKTADVALLAPLSSSHEPSYSGILPPEVSRQAVEHFIRNEWASHLTDVMIRRSSWRYYHRDHARIASTVAGWMSEILGWTPEQTDREIQQYTDVVEQTAVGPQIQVQLPQRPRAARVQTA
jgi:glycerol-3-phosphate dehydrogenase